MKNISWSRIDWFLLAVILATFVVSFFLWDRLPETVPTHWNISGEVDGWGGKWMNLLLFPTINLGMLLLFSFLPKLDPLKKNYKEFAKEYQGFKVLIILFFTYVYGIIIYSSLYPNFFQISLFPIGFGLLFLYIGYIMPRFRPNWFVGIKTPWTLSSEKSWKKTHYLGGLLFMIAGGSSIITGIFLHKYSFYVFLPLIFIASIVPIVYSYFIWKKDQK